MEKTDMAQYLVSVQRPKGYDGRTESAERRAEIGALNNEMVAAGVRVFVGGLREPDSAKALRRAEDGGRHRDRWPLCGKPRIRRRLLGSGGCEPGRGSCVGPQGGRGLPLLD